MSDKKDIKKANFNPIDKDKITETPHLLEYAHTVGGAIIKPIDKGRVKGNAMKAMFQQTDTQLNQIKDQVTLLLQQAKEIHDRIEISEKIYKASVGFVPTIDQEYHLFEKKDGSWVLSLVSPEEWGSNPPYFYIASVKLLADHTWHVIRKAEGVDFEI